MPTPTVITDLSTVIASNFPAGSNAPSVLDDVQRAHAAFIAQLRDRTAADWPNTPAAGVTETTVQGAIDGLEARKSTYHNSDIINGNFPIAQAGTSFAAPASGAHDLDGWANLNTSAAVFTVAQVAGSTSGRLARQVTITTADATVAAGDYVCDSAAIEGYNVEKYVGSTFTIGFRAKVPVAGVHCVALRNSGNDRSYVKEINFPTAGVYQDCSFTVTGGLPTAGTWDYTNGTGLKVTFAHMCGTTFQTTPDAWNIGNFLGTANQVNDCATVGNVWALEKVTLNLGTVAAVSEISYEGERTRCQTYYWRVSAASNAAYATGAIWTSGSGDFTLQLPVTMRAAPTVTSNQLKVYDGATAPALTISSTVNSVDHLFVQWTSSGLNASRPAGIQASGTSSFIAADARLSHV